ncbi:MAG: single-stranded DNA-binding protein [Bacteroidetes bacterium]|nr:single-stranded DNA-binding protein [Bacteroidota bacterium]
MALSLNKVMLVGNLGRDVETRFSNDNSLTISSFTMATSRSTKGKDGNWINESTWHNIVTFNLNDKVLEGLRKGVRVYVEGRIQIREYTKQDNTPAKVYEIVAERVQLVDKKQEDGSSPFEAYGAGPKSEGNGPSEPEAGKKVDDDLPF